MYDLDDCTVGMKFVACLQGGGNRWGTVGATCPPPQLEAVGPPPTQLLTVNVVHFYFCLLLRVNLRPYQKMVGKIRDVFSFR